MRPLTCALAALVLSASLAFAGHATIEVQETAGLGREGWLIHVGVPVPADVDTDALRLVEVDGLGLLREIAFQVLDEVEPVYLGDRRPNNLIKTVEIAFLADVSADGSHEYRLYHADTDEQIAPRTSADGDVRLEIESDDRLGRTIDTGAARFGFHPDSGQLISYRLAGNDHTLDFVPGGRVRPVHGGADIWAPPQSWGNVRNWDLDSSDDRIAHHEAAGPIAWRMVRTGRVPNSNQTEAALTYTAFAGAPFILETSKIRFTHDTMVHAVRNNQLVFRRGYHTHGLYIDHDGGLTHARGFDPDDPDTHFRRLGLGLLPPDVPFVGLFHESHGHGIGMVTLGRASAATRRVASTGDVGAYYYFYDGKLRDDIERDFFYFARAEVFPATYDERWRWHQTVIPTGSLFASQSAILVFPVDEAGDDANRFEELRYWTKRLRHPPRVRVR